MITYPINANAPETNKGVKSFWNFLRDKSMDVLNSFVAGQNKLSRLQAEMVSHTEIFDRSALVSISDLKGRIIYANDKFCETSGYVKEELMHMPHSVIRHPDTPKSVFKQMWTTIGNGEVWQGELKNRTKNGLDYWVIATIAPVLGVNGKPVKYISVRYDITKQKQTEEELRLEKQKVDNELHQNIAYAKHIHSSFLINDAGDHTCNDSFLIYKALKIISGDFYKIKRVGEKIMLVVGDSTGHGVPASYISISALNILSRVMCFCSDNPARILKLINKELNKITHFNKDKQLIETVDMIICCIDKERMKLTYASARMKAIIVRGDEIIVLEKNKSSIGESCNHDFHIKSHVIDIVKGDQLYVFSDGLTDQIGGLHNKCIGFKNIQSLIKEMRNAPMPFQKRILESALLAWQNNNEQTDDMTVYGIKI